MQSVLAFNALSALSYLLLTLLFRRPAVKRCLCSIGIVHSIVGGQRLLRVRWPHPIIPYFQSNHHISYHEPINIFRSRNIHIYIYEQTEKFVPLYQSKEMIGAKPPGFFDDYQWHIVCVQKVQSIYFSMRKGLETIYSFHIVFILA